MSFKINFNKLGEEKSPEERAWLDASMQLNLAEWSWSDMKKGKPSVSTNQSIYDILKAVAQIPGVLVDLEKYEHLQLWQPDVDMDALREAKLKMKEARDAVAALRVKMEESKDD